MANTKTLNIAFKPTDPSLGATIKEYWSSAIGEFPEISEIVLTFDEENENFPQNYVYDFNGISVLLDAFGQRIKKFKRTEIPLKS